MRSPLKISFSDGPGSWALFVKANNGLIRIGWDGLGDEMINWASVTKPVTALIVLSLVQEGVFSLDEVLTSNGASTAHLLSHCSGMSPEDENLFLTSPGKRRIYSNAGYRFLGRLAEKRTGLSYQELVESRVCAPLGFKCQAGEDPASSISSTFGQLAAFVEGLFLGRSGFGEDIYELCAQSFGGTLPGVVPGVGRYRDCAWGLGFEIKDAKEGHWMPEEASSKAFGHFGRSGALLVIDPHAGLAYCAASSKGFEESDVARWRQAGGSLFRLAEEVREGL